MPALLMFPLTLAFYPLPPRTFLLINLVAVVGLMALLLPSPISDRAAVNFFLMYWLALWIGSVALRVLQRQQLRLFMLERRHAESARTDVLTGLVNRRSLEEHGAQMLRRARRGGRPLSLLMIDLDHFKQINDLHGHDVGDQALVHAARLLSRAVRDDDLLGRWGGEEFVAILDNSAEAAAGRVAQRCIDLLRGEPMSRAGEEPIQLGASVGVAELRADESLDALVKRADAALYQAKQAGRGRFELAV